MPENKGKDTLMKNKFYILVPIYNVERYIESCIKSVLSQTYQNFRLILVDDGSPDNCGKICDEYAENDSRIYVIHKRNEGLISARRAAINYVKESFDCDESFFVFLDSDDSLKATALEVLNSTILHNKCDMVVYSFDRIRFGKKLEDSIAKNVYFGNVEDKRELYKIVFLNQYNNLWRKCVKGSLLDCLDYSQFYNIGMGEDLLQSIPIYKNCTKATFISDSLYNYTFNENSITNNNDYRKFESESAVRKEVWNFLKEENVWTADDFAEYIKYIKVRINEMIKRIIYFDCGYNTTRNMLSELSSDDFYSMFIDESSSNDGDIYRLKNGHIVQLFAKNKLRKFLSKIYHTFKTEKTV